MQGIVNVNVHEQNETNERFIDVKN
jgi:hypothetical protein